MLVCSMLVLPPPLLGFVVVIVILHPANYHQLGAQYSSHKVKTEQVRPPSLPPIPVHLFRRHSHFATPPGRGIDSIDGCNTDELETDKGKILKVCLHQNFHPPAAGWLLG